MQVKVVDFRELLFPVLSLSRNRRVGSPKLKHKGNQYTKEKTIWLISFVTLCPLCLKIKENVWQIN